MLNLQTQFNGDLSSLLRGTAKGLTDLRALSQPVMRLMDQGNREGIGTDVSGNALAPLRFSTLLRRKGSGPPLAPHGLASRIFSATRFSAAGAGGTLAVEMSWDLPWLKYHRTGTSRMKARDISSQVRPITVTEVRLLLWGYFKDLVTPRG